MNNAILRRTLLQALGATPLAVGPARAQQGYPDRPIRVVVPYAAGGGTDVTARAATQRLTAELGQQMPVDNRTGANTAIGAEYVARARPDGYTLFVSGSTTFVLLPLLTRRLPFQISDFAPISQLTRFPMACVVNASVQGGFADIVERIKRAPSEFVYAHTGIGSSGHLMGERLFMTHGLRLTSIPYRGFAPTLVDMLAGRIPMTFESVPAVMPYHRDGRVRIVAVSSPERWAALPDVPTFRELGYASMAFQGWFGMVAPTGTPAPIIERLSQAIAKISADPGYREAIGATGQQVVHNTPEDFASLIATETAEWRSVIEPLNISLD
ncbi:MAG: tripartite tricarboxylate transporter substrate binding protein [Pseudomonadota bacterium]